MSWKNIQTKYQPLYSNIELAADEISLDPSSNILRFVMRPGGSEPGPDGDGKWRAPIPGGVALPKPESESIQCDEWCFIFLFQIFWLVLILIVNEKCEIERYTLLVHEFLKWIISRVQMRWFKTKNYKTLFIKCN